MRTALLIAAFLLGFTAALPADADRYPRPELLLEPAELARPEVAERWIVLDVRSQEKHLQGHIPMARRVDHDAWAKAFGDGQDVEGWSQRIGELGIGADSHVVVYDDKGMKEAARVWWLLRYWGVQDVRLLNGGWKTWNAERLPTSQELSTAVQPVKFPAKPHAEQWAGKQQVLDALPGKQLQIVDSRSEKEFCGLDALGNQRAGAMPGAKHLEWSDLVDAKTHRFKSPEELRRLMNEAGIELTRPTVTHCQSGGRSSVMAFGLELMGAKDVRNYYRGWSEWGNDPDTPVVATAKAEPK